MAKIPVALDDHHRQEEAERVLAWRTEVCLALGYSVPSAERLAASNADLRRLEQMIESGCSRSLAKRIVL